MEGYVRMTVSGPVLATLILAGWLELQGGTMDLGSERTEYWVELPCVMVYDLTSDVRGPKRATLRRANAAAGRQPVDKPCMAGPIGRHEPQMKNRYTFLCDR